MMADATGQITAERWQEIKAIVAEALEEKSATARVALIRARCGSDAGLLSEVESLLEQTTGSLEEFAQSTTESLQRQMSILAPSQRVGAYRVLRELGRGGMGAVYLAERADGAFEKQVAIKVLKRGTDTDEVLRRFRSEREILARLDHPNIGRLLDAGTTDDALPYFVMDYVDGKPITKYADEKRLSLTERLKLFRIVCSAVSYAHQNLVIHRDIKPSNVFVTNDGEVKLLDFGIAKVVQEAESEHQVTATMLRVLTPEYASPEQVKGERVTTVSDVYSLGVFLYELLTGERPYKLKRRTPEEITKAIREQEPERPSTAITRSASNVVDFTRRQLRGDLDNIVLKALRKEPERRYASVDQFSADIRRHLEGLPVRARKDTAAYRASKFIRRHKLAVTAAAVVLMVLIAGIVTTTLEARAAKAQRANAERRFNDVRKIANSFMFEILNSIKDLPGALAARQLIMERALEYLDSLVHDARNDPSLTSELALAYNKIGHVTFNVQQAIASHQKAAALNEALVHAAPNNMTYRKQLSESYDDLSDVMKIAGNSSQAIDYARRALALMQPLATERVSDNEMQAALASRHLSLGIALNDTGNFKEALDVDLAGMSIQQKLVAQNSGDIEMRRYLAEFYGTVSDAYEDLGDFRNALDYGRKELETTSQIFQSDPASVRYRRDIWTSYFRTGRQLLRTGDTNGAAESYSMATALMEALAAADPNDTGHQRWLALTYFSIGNLLVSTDQLDKAHERYRKAIAISEKLLAADPDRVEVRRDLAKMHRAAGQLLGKLGQTSRALEELNKAASLAETSANQDPNNTRVSRFLGELCSDIADSYRNLAAQRDLSTTTRKADLRKARDWYQRGFDRWQELKTKNALREIETAKPDEVAREIAKCDVELAR